MDTLINLISISLAVFSAILSWHYGTKKRRLHKRVDRLEKKREQINSYTETTGYKTIIHDCFAIISFALGILLVSIAVELLIFTQLSGLLNRWILLVVHSFLTGAILGAGVALIEMFQTLKKAQKPKESISEINKEIEQYKNEANKH